MEYGIRKLSFLQVQHLFYKALNLGAFETANACQREIARRVEILKPTVDLSHEETTLTAIG